MTPQFVELVEQKDKALVGKNKDFVRKIGEFVFMMDSKTAIPDAVQEDRCATYVGSYVLVTSLCVVRCTLLSGAVVCCLCVFFVADSSLGHLCSL